MTQPWLFLILAGFFEIGMTTFLKLSEGLTRFPYRGLFFLCSLISFLLLSRAISGNNAIPLGTAYAVWTGIGAAGTALIGIYFYKDPVSLSRLLLLAGLVACVIGLQLVESSGGHAK